MSEGTIKNGSSAITFGLIGKMVIGAIVGGIPALIAVGIWIAMHITQIEAKQTFVLEVMHQTQQATLDNQEAIKALDIRVWNAQVSAASAAHEAAVGRKEITGQLGQVKAAVKEKIPDPRFR